jgi:hypothetical protein
MASYKDAVQWIAINDGAGDTPGWMKWDDALPAVDGLVTVCLVADVFDRDQDQVAADVLRARGFRKPRGARLASCSSK